MILRYVRDFFKMMVELFGVFGALFGDIVSIAIGTSVFAGCILLSAAVPCLALYVLWKLAFGGGF